MRFDKVLVWNFRGRFRRYFETLQRLPIPLLQNTLEKLTSRKKMSYSSYGEDLLLQGIMSRYKLKFKTPLQFSYVDIGAWKPISGSNTYVFYKNGISGTAVEPNPQFRTAWKALRPRDNFLEVGCSSNENEILNIFHDSAASNTFDATFAEKISIEQNLLVGRKLEVRCLTLSSIIDKHLSIFPGPFILDIDVEGRDLDVLLTFDFPTSKRPLLILIEDTPQSGLSVSKSRIHDCLVGHSYKLVSRASITSIYVDNFHQLASILSPII